MKIGDYLKPKNPDDPLEKTTGYGWGWFILLAYTCGGIQRINNFPPGSRIVMTFICLPFILFIYFRSRKIFIDKKKISIQIWQNSFMAGIIATLSGFVFIFLFSVLINITGIRFE